MIEQNWKWSKKTFPHTLCVVSTSDETTQRGICLTSNKNLHWASWAGSLGQNGLFWDNILLQRSSLSFVREIFQRAD